MIILGVFFKWVAVNVNQAVQPQAVVSNFIRRNQAGGLVSEPFNKTPQIKFVGANRLETPIFFDFQILQELAEACG